MRFTIVNSTDGLLHVHIWGCRDLDREMHRANGQWIAEADNPEELITQQIRESDEGTMFEDTFKVFPCAYKGCELGPRKRRKAGLTVRLTKRQCEMLAYALSAKDGQEPQGCCGNTARGMVTIESLVKRGLLEEGGSPNPYGYYLYLYVPTNAARQVFVYEYLRQRGYEVGPTRAHNS